MIKRLEPRAEYRNCDAPFPGCPFVSFRRRDRPRVRRGLSRRTRRLAQSLFGPARADRRPPDQGVRQGNRDRCQSPLRGSPRARQPAGEGGKVVPGGRFLHRELAGTRIAVGEGAVGESRSGDAGQRAGPGQRIRRRLGRRFRPRKRAGLQHRHDPGGGVACVAARPGEAGVEGQDRNRADRRRFPPAGRSCRGDERASGRSGVAQGPARQRHDLRR